MAIADHCRGKVFKGHKIPYGTFSMDEENSEVRAAYYGYGYRRDEDMPPLPCIELDDQVVDPEEELSKKELLRVLEEKLDTLHPRLAKVLRMRFGIGTACEMTLEEVGTAFDVSKERIRQLEAKALRKLKSVKLWDVVYPKQRKDEWIERDRIARVWVQRYEFEMLQMGNAWLHFQLKSGTNPDRHPKADTWIEHIRITDPKLHRIVSNEVSQYLRDPAN